MSDPTFYLAGCVITDDQKRILMLHRNTPKRVQWELPGAKIDPAEDARATAAKAIKDELGIDVQVRHLLGDKHTEEEGRIVHYSWFATLIVAGQPAVLSDAHDNFAYLSVDELKQLHHKLSPSGRSFLEFVHRGDIRL